MKEQEYKKIYIKIKKYIEEICSFFKIDTTKIEVEYIFPHSRKEKLRPGDRAIYIFYFPLQKQFLKIGKASDNTCFQYRHYKYNSQKPTWKSSLPKSLWTDEKFKEKNLKNRKEEELGTWILENTERINIIIRKEIGDKDKLTFTTNLLETCLQYEYKPIYEGHRSQRKNP